MESGQENQFSSLRSSDPFSRGKGPFLAVSKMNLGGKRQDV